MRDVFDPSPEPPGCWLLALGFLFAVSVPLALIFWIASSLHAP